ncbi:MAG TPA: DUF4214 domain-containing protein [Burkholderiaceae bacterium]
MKIARISAICLALCAILTACGGAADGSGKVDAYQHAVPHAKTTSTDSVATYGTVVQQLYIAYFGRPADSGGLTNFSAALQAAGAPADIGNLSVAYTSNPTLKALIDSFGTSAESQTLYGSGTTSSFVTAIFQNVLGRAPASSGLAFWVTAIDSGNLTKADAALAIMAGAEANTTTQGRLDAALIANRITIAENFTSTISTSAYVGPAAAADARTMLGTVTSTTDPAAFQATIASTIGIIANQAIFEGMALHGGESTLVFNIPYGGGTLVTGTNYIYSNSTGTLTASPATGPQVETPVYTSLDVNLSVPASSPTRVLLNGKINLLAAQAPRRITYIGNAIHVDYLADDGQTALTSSLFYNYVSTSLSGLMDNSPEQVLANVPIKDWINFNNFSANAQWQAGAAYVVKQGNRASDTYIVNDCNNVANPVYTKSTTPTPCKTATTLDNFFPVSLIGSYPNYPYETDFAGDGTITTVQGMRMWIANAPLPLEQSPVLAYRTYFEMGGNVYLGMLEKNGAPYNYSQSDGSVVNYLVTFNQAAVASVQAGIITGTVVPGTQVGTGGTVFTTDLFGIGGQGVNGSLAPADLRTHYNIPANLDGAGQKIVIIDPPGTGNVLADLNAFSKFYKLPQCNTNNPCFQHIDLSNGATPSANNDAGREIELDTQMAHGIAPKATIVLLTAASNSFSDLNAAMNYAGTIQGATVVSLSIGGNAGVSTQKTEDANLAQIQSLGGPVYFASSGDSGYLATAQYPAASPYVTAVGGTRINSVPWSSSASETAWQYSSGGPSAYFAMPSWQTALLSAASISGNNNMRAIPDVAAVADPQHSAVGTYYKNSWSMAGGTSVSAPIWAGIGALFGQYLTAKGQSLSSLTSTLPGGFNGMLYQAKLTQGSPGGFYDVISGSNNLTTNACAICDAGTGYDSVTGLGAPNVTALFSNF